RVLVEADGFLLAVGAAEPGVPAVEVLAVEEGTPLFLTGANGRHGEQSEETEAKRALHGGSSSDGCWYAAPRWAAVWQSDVDLLRRLLFRRFLLGFVLLGLLAFVLLGFDHGRFRRRQDKSRDRLFLAMAQHLHAHGSLAGFRQLAKGADLGRHILAVP